VPWRRRRCYLNPTRLTPPSCNIRRQHARSALARLLSNPVQVKRVAATRASNSSSRITSRGKTKKGKVVLRVENNERSICQRRDWVHLGREPLVCFSADLRLAFGEEKFPILLLVRVDPATKKFYLFLFSSTQPRLRGIGVVPLSAGVSIAFVSHGNDRCCRSPRDIYLSRTFSVLSGQKAPGPPRGWRLWFEMIDLIPLRNIIFLPCQSLKKVQLNRRKKKYFAYLTFRLDDEEREDYRGDYMTYRHVIHLNKVSSLSDIIIKKATH